MTDLDQVLAIPDPEARAVKLDALVGENQELGLELSRLRKLAIEELISDGWSQTRIAALLGMTRSRVSLLLSAGVRAERGFLGAGSLSVAIGGKQERGRSAGKSVLSAEAFSAFGVLADLAKTCGWEASHEVVPPPGIVDLNRSNLIVLTSPRLLPFVGQVMGADPYLQFRQDNEGWYLHNLSSGEEYRSNDADHSTDYAYIGRLPRPDGKGTFLYLAGIHANGTLAAAQFIADNLYELYRDLKKSRFSMIISASFDHTDPMRITDMKKITPAYKHEGGQ